MKKWIGNILIVSSAALLIWLWSGTLNTEKEQDRIIEAFAAIKETSESGQSITTDLANSDEKKEAKTTLPPNVEGILSIPSIKLKSPVLTGANPNNLNQALGSITGLDEPGIVNGSYAIAGHQSHVFGEFFNRLNELQVGDQFSYETLEETLLLEVFDIKIVKPHQVSSLNPQKGIALFSLITCYPKNSNKYRLIIHAKRV